MNTPSSIDLDTIWEHRAWVAGLARGLLFDQASVDDVVQETWLVALRSRPEDPGALQAWLGGVVRNVVRHQVRGEGRRRQHETAAAAREAVGGSGKSTDEGVDELVVRAESHRRLVAAVIALEEPARRVVLLRYFQGKSAEEIARDEGLPSSTVRSRLSRALDVLRVRLTHEVRDAQGPRAGGASGAEESAGRARRDWMLGLLPLALEAEVGLFEGAIVSGAGGLAGASSATSAAGKAATANANAGASGFQGGWVQSGVGGKGAGAARGGVEVAMGWSKLQLCGLLTVLLSVAGAWWWLDESTGAPPSTEAIVALPTSTSPVMPQPQPASLASELVVEPLALVPGPASEPLSGDWIVGRLVDAEGRPVEGAELRFAWHSGDDEGLLGARTGDRRAPLSAEEIEARRVFSAADGSFEVPVDLRGMDVEYRTETYLVILHPEHVTRLHGNPLLRTGAPIDVGEIRLVPGAQLSGRVVSERGEALAGVSVRLRQLSPVEPSHVQSGLPTESFWFTIAQRIFVRTETDASGRFTLSGLPTGRVALKLDRADLTPTAIAEQMLAPQERRELEPSRMVPGQTLTGSVADSNGERVPNATVYVRAEDAAPWWPGPSPLFVGERLRGLTRTDDSGVFRFGGLADTEYSVHAIADGFAYTRLGGCLPGEELRIELEAPGKILVRVEDATTGQALDARMAWVFLPSDEVHDEVERFVGAWPLSSEAQADSLAAGEILISGAGREGTRFLLEHPGYLSQEVLIGPVAANERIEFVARLSRVPAAVASLRGFVVDENDEPVIGASVQIAPREKHATSRRTVSEHTDENGAFVLASVEEGLHALWVSHPAHVEEGLRSDEVMLPSVDDEPLILRAVRHGAVSGRVLDEGGAPAPWVSVGAIPMHEIDVSGDTWQGWPVAMVSEAPTRSVLTRSDEHGFFRFNELYPGPWEFFAAENAASIELRFRVDRFDADARAKMIADAGWPTVSLTVDGGNNEDLEVPLMPSAPVEGVVLRDGQPLGGVPVHLMRTPESGPWRIGASTLSDAQGRFSLSLPESGPAVVAAQPAGHFATVAPVELEFGQVASAKLQLAGQTLRGRLHSEENGRVLMNVDLSVEWQPTDAATLCFPALGVERSTRLARSTKLSVATPEVDAEGVFLIGSLRPGLHRLEVEADGHRDQIEVFELNAEAAPPELDLVLERAG